MRYTALDILKLAGVEAPEEKIGKVSVAIGGVNVNRLDKVINVVGKSVSILIGREITQFEMPAEQDPLHAENVKKIKEAEGEK